MSKKNSKVTAKKTSSSKKRASKKKAAAKPARSRSTKKKASAAKSSEVEKVGPLTLDSTLCIQSVSKLSESLAEKIDSDETVELDISNVESVDTASLQVLIAFVNSLQLKGKSVKWTGSSPIMSEILKLTDLASYLPIDTSESEDTDDGLCPVF